METKCYRDGAVQIIHGNKEEMQFWNNRHFDLLIFNILMSIIPKSIILKMANGVMQW